MSGSLDAKGVQEARIKKNKIRTLRVVSSVLERIISRQKNNEPVVRYSLLVNNICLGLDGLIAYMDLEAEDLPSELSDKMKLTSTMLSDELNGLFKWIQSPHYSPDHPWGKSLMIVAEIHHQNIDPCISNQTSSTQTPSAQTPHHPLKLPLQRPPHPLKLPLQQSPHHPLKLPLQQSPHHPLKLHLQ